MTDLKNLRVPAENRAEVETRASKSLEVALLAMNLHPMDKAVVTRVVSAAYPKFCGQMHEERSSGTPAAVVQLACEIVFTNMLYETVVSLAPPKKRDDMLRDFIKKIRGGVLQALIMSGSTPEYQNTLQAAEAVNETGVIEDGLATAIYAAIKARYPDGEVNLGDVTSACGAIAGLYLSTLPENIRTEKVELFCNLIRLGAGEPQK